MLAVQSCAPQVWSYYYRHTITCSALFSGQYICNVIMDQENFTICGSNFKFHLAYLKHRSDVHNILDKDYKDDVGIPCTLCRLVFLKDNLHIKLRTWAYLLSLFHFHNFTHWLQNNDVVEALK